MHTAEMQSSVPLVQATPMAPEPEGQLESVAFEQPGGQQESPPVHSEIDW